MNLCRFLFAASVSVCLLLPGSARAFRYRNDDQGHDFYLMGIGVWRQNYTEVDGPRDLFEDSDDGLPEAYSNRSRFALFGEGAIFRDYTFKLKANYDEEDDEDDQGQFLFELHRDRHFMIVGDHEDGAFQDTVFTAQDEEIRGLTLHAETEKAAATLMAGALKGEAASDEIRADGTSGPYRLEEAPVIEGSETVVVEIRDRANPARVIQRRHQQRGTDYRIDYDDGEITFDDPVEEQDFRGNPVFIIVTYQYEDADGGRYKRSTYGGRLVLTPNKAVRGGVTFLADGPWDDGDTGKAWDERREIYGADLAVKFNDRYHIGAEMAQSRIPGLDDDLRSNAAMVNIDTNPTDPLRIYGRYWRAEKNFLSFGNLNLQGDNVEDEIDLDEPFSFKSADLEFDLDPNIDVTHGVDENSYGVSAVYELSPFQSVSAGFRETRFQFSDNDIPTETTRNMFAAIKRLDPEHTDWLLAVEKIDRHDDLNPHQFDTSANRLLAALKHPPGRYRFLGDTFFQAAYQFENFTDHLNGDNDAHFHDLLLRGEFNPVQDVVVYVEQAEQLVYEKAEDDFTRRTDTSLLGAEGKFNRYFDVDLSLKYSREYDLIEDKRFETVQTYHLEWTSLPLDMLKTRLKYEYTKTDNRDSDRVGIGHNYGGEVNWDIRTNLTATARYAHEEDKDQAPGAADQVTESDDMTFRLDYEFRTRLKLFGGYRLEKETVEAPPLDETTTDTTTWLAGLKYQIDKSWDLLGSYKYKRLEEAVEDERIKSFAELGYQLNPYLKISLGYEYFAYTDEDTAEDYDAHVGYFSLTGNL